MNGEKRSKRTANAGERAATIREQPVTYDDYANMPDDGKRYEIADGVLESMSPGPTPKHQVISYFMQNVLTNGCQNDYIVIASPVDLILSPTEVRQPDIVMINRSRIGIITRRGIEGIPDLVVEILSPHSVKRDRFDKLDVYSAYRIPEYWIADPGNEALEQYVLSDGSYELLNVYERDEAVRSERLPCVSFTMGQILDAAADLPG
ncbi:Uma2 family endonuclease [Cohnella algarum]|mgnify:CR=1 FL=1|uniref:Uma2 family endonuclease n=1 Tax=Cohnella algarum TaxID=2044859 RepID=UPI0019679DBA|nr:Uma2 family endonuclease [Cohnella algarum]MBN2982881.1 Uma2 family endonuclease [Cohnella algarum]